VGLFELMTSTPEVRELIIHRAPSDRIVSAAKQAGLRLLREDGWQKVRCGLTTPEEVVRSTKL
jgi:type II secretory ATPase GspE/PulE/Tfp pilus assembly ATPase PilB-like protein